VSCHVIRRHFRSMALFAARDFIDNSLAAACECTKTPLHDKGMIVFRIVTRHPDRPGIFLQFTNTFQGMEKKGLERY